MLVPRSGPSRNRGRNRAQDPPGSAAGRWYAHTRRRLRGRQPLCGMGVTSRIEVTMKPAA